MGKTRVENPQDPSYQVLQSLNMGSITSKNHEMDILDSSIQSKAPLRPTHPPTHPSRGPTNQHYDSHPCIKGSEA